MGIKGFQGTSLLDFPGRISALVFFGGCNLTCPFCHNPSLVEEPHLLPDIPPDSILEELSHRRTFIDGVVATGGEPTLARELPSFLGQVKRLGLDIKLDTNGLRPDVLQDLVAAGLVDYLALDLKTSPERYGELHSAEVDTGALVTSASLAKTRKVPGEIRTTCVPGLVEETDIERMGEVVRGAELWVLQAFVPRYSLDPELREQAPLSVERLETLAGLARRYVGEVRLRGIA